jgi:protein-L-isoaspartate(D-aspartate) O-methyltransferase
MKQIFRSEKISYHVPAWCAISALLLLIFFIASAAQGQNEPFSAQRTAMIEKDLKGRNINDPAVLKAMQKVPRHLFVKKDLQEQAYNDYPLPIGEGQTISQPYIVALMTQSLGLKKEDTVLEIGTGSGYQAAVLAEIVQQVYSVEIKRALAESAEALLKTLGYRTIRIKAGDGFQGWKEHAPYDAILVTCAIDRIPPPLIAQLKEGGKIILPLGDTLGEQELVLGVKKNGRIERKTISAVRFVPMVGDALGKQRSAE